MNNRVTLRIKKIYFDRIESGEKIIEYRDFKPYYERIFEKGIVKEVLFHYQGIPKLLVDVENIKVIKTPKRLKESAIPFGPNVYAIKLKNPKRVD